MNNALFWIFGMILTLTLSMPSKALEQSNRPVDSDSSGSQYAVNLTKNEPPQHHDSGQTIKEIQNRIAAIENLSSLQGAYGNSLIEAHSDLGALLSLNGNAKAAAAAYRQAWHLSRVNTGLYSEAQLPHLNALIENLAEDGEWQEVHKLHKLSFLIASRIYPPDDLRYSIAAEFYSNWQWEAINGRLLSGAFPDVFLSAQELSVFYTEVIDKIEHAGVPENASLINLVLGKARTDMVIARALVSANLNSSVLGPGSYITEAKCFTEVAQNGRNLRQCRRVQLAGFAQDSGLMLSRNFALGRYLEQIELSINKLEQICGDTEAVSPAEKAWVESLVSTLKRETNGVYRSAGRIRT